jgi:diguanylate cyclase (GGDEF)-like protein
MRAIKNLAPILILLFLSIYSYQKYFQISQALLNGIIFLPVVLTLLILGLSIHFNRSLIFFYALDIAIVNIVLGLKLAGSDLSYALLSAFVPLSMLVLTVLPERGVLSVRAVPAYAVLFISIGLSIGLINISPEWVNTFFLTDWFPERYFDWTTQSQTVLIVSIVTIVVMLVLYFVRPSPHMSAGLGILVVLIMQLHFGEVSRSLNVFSSAALLMCLYAVMQESWRMAYLDELTELPGRRALREKFQKMGGLYTVAMLDVDHFKKFNDTYGHDTGDAVLRMIATKMSKINGGGSCYRYGGEEFSIVFTGKNAENAKQYLENLREKIASTPFVINRVSRRKGDKKPKQQKNKSVKVTVSIGVSDSGSISKDSVCSPWDVLKLSDKALYRAKSKGRNCVSN